jgi:hypothetical protein
VSTNFILTNVQIKFNKSNNNSKEPPPINDSKYPNIYNIARAHLTTTEKEILNKGLKFFPTPKQASAITHETAITNLYRKILIQGHYALEGADDDIRIRHEADRAFQDKHKAKSSWIPQPNQVLAPILKFAELLKSELIDLPTNSKGREFNISRKHRVALNRIRQRKDIIIKPADKGGGICILTPEQYTKEAYSQLYNDQHYKELHSDPMNSIQTKIRNTITKHNNSGAIPNKTASLLVQQDPKPARFYLLPKIHKNVIDPPGRPIAASNGHPTERISQYLDEILKEHITDIPSYIKDTNHFLQICHSTTLPDNAKIATFDVTGLYTNIPHDEGVMALEEFMMLYTTRKRVNMIRDLTRLVLTNNIIEFNGRLFIQLSGTSMGSKFAPSYACIYMNWFEKTHLPNAPIQPVIWRRYIDDIFAVFMCTDEQLVEFYEIGRAHV